MYKDPVTGVRKNAATTSVQHHNLEAEVLILGYVP